MNTYVIIGNGVAGTHAAVHLRKRSPNSSISLVSEETPYFYSRTALMYIAMNKMQIEDTEPFERSYYAENNINLIHDTCINIDIHRKEVNFKKNKTLSYDKLLLATGSKPAMFGWPGSDLEGVINFVSYQDLQKLQKLLPHVRKATVVGGGLIGIELVEVLLHYSIDVTFLIREDTFWPRALSAEEGRMIEQHMIDHGVTVLMSTECKEINGENGRVTSVAIGDGTILETDLVGFATGVWPNSSMAKESKIPINKGILVNEYLQTEVDDIYAAGDCVERKSVVHNETAISAIWYSSRDMGITAARNLLGDNVMFSQGSWYNSAKFLDLEYTSVGHYLPKSEKEQNIFIKDQQKEVSIRIVHEQNICKGFSMLGSRWDHTVLQRFIDEQRTVEYFFDNISKTQFDPEFMNRNLTLKKNSK